MKTVYIFFGEMGCGKSYCGARFADRHNIKFFEGDSVVTPRMMAQVKKFRPITSDMLEEYIDVLCDAIADQMEYCSSLVVSQALYSNEHRDSVKKFLECLGYQVRMIWVRSPFWQNFRNLLTREHGWKWACYWLLSKPFFQKPTHDHSIFTNIPE